MRRIVLVCALLIAGCVTPKEYYTKSETGPHGVVTVQKVYYTPEELAARNEAERYANSRPGDPQMRSIEQNWPKLTDDQRTTIMQTVERMAQGK